MEIVVIGLVALLVIAYLVITNKKDKEKVKRNQKAEMERRLAEAAAWAVDYRNPESPNYDPVAAQEYWDNYLNGL